jgi:hypothetical protein
MLSLFDDGFGKPDPIAHVSCFRWQEELMFCSMCDKQQEIQASQSATSFMLIFFGF